jgi:hypothetical protein
MKHFSYRNKFEIKSIDAALIEMFTQHLLWFSLRFDYELVTITRSLLSKRYIFTRLYYSLGEYEVRRDNTEELTPSDVSIS